jgi:hypothetical protein
MVPSSQGLLKPVLEHVFGHLKASAPQSEYVFLRPSQELALVIFVIEPIFVILAPIAPVKQ